jgi:recombination protein RecA
VKVVKNKVAPPFRVAEFDIIYGEGISTEGTLLDLAVERDIIHKSGAFFSYQDQKIAQGRDNARLYLKSHPELTAEIDKKLREELFAAKKMTEEEASAVTAQNQEEEDDLALLEEELDEV